MPNYKTSTIRYKKCEIIKKRLDIFIYTDHNIHNKINII